MGNDVPDDKGLAQWVKGAIWALGIALIVVSAIGGAMYNFVVATYNAKFAELQDEMERSHGECKRDREGIRAILDALIPQCAATISKVERNSADILRIGSTDSLLAERLSSLQADVSEHRKQGFGEKIDKLNERQDRVIDRIHELERRADIADAEHGNKVKRGSK